MVLTGIGWYIFHSFPSPIPTISRICSSSSDLCLQQLVCHTVADHGQSFLSLPLSWGKKKERKKNTHFAKCQERALSFTCTYKGWDLLVFLSEDKEWVWLSDYTPETSAYVINKLSWCQNTIVLEINCERRKCWMLTYYWHQVSWAASCTC